MSVKLIMIYTITSMFSINLKIPLSGKKMHVEVIMLHRIKKVQHVVLRKSRFKVYDGYCAYNYFN